MKWFKQHSFLLTRQTNMLHVTINRIQITKPDK